MDEPVTDVAFVVERKHCPKGYKLVDECPCGHEAQLWEKVLGGKDVERFLCYTKEDKDGTVITDMYIPKRTAQYLHKGYKIIEKTVEGRTPMRHRQLAVKRVPRNEATKVVADIIVCRSRDDPSQMYKKLEQMDYKPKPQDTSTSDWDRALKERSTSDPPPPHNKDHRMRAATIAVVAAQELSGKMKTMELSREDTDSGSSYYTPSPPPVVSPLPDRTLSPPNATTERVSPDCSAPPLNYEVATVEVSSVLTSAPPPPPSSSHTTSYPPQSREVPPRVPSPRAQASYTQPNAYQTPSPYSGYPPYQPGPTTGYYPPQQPAAAFPPPQTSGYGPTGYDTRIGFAFGSGGAFGGAFGGGYPPAQPQAGGYSSIAGSSFVGATPVAQSSGPAPYNPYMQGSRPYPPTTGYPPPPSQPPGQNYGFNF